MTESRKNAVIVLHEIYGINRFIEDICAELKFSFNVFCPDMLKRKAFSYGEGEAAYHYFRANVGFGEATRINSLIDELKSEYDKVFLIGFSAGATIAWICSENPRCDGVIGLYGSRIRDYTDIQPLCKTLLIFANENSFNTDGLILQAEGKDMLECVKVEAEHGFMDPYTDRYNPNAALAAREIITGFLRKLSCTG